MWIDRNGQQPTSHDAVDGMFLSFTLMLNALFAEKKCWIAVWFLLL
jgi:hypothetical protein